MPDKPSFCCDQMRRWCDQCMIANQGLLTQGGHKRVPFRHCPYCGTRVRLQGISAYVPDTVDQAEDLIQCRNALARIARGETAVPGLRPGMAGHAQSIAEETLRILDLAPGDRVPRRDALEGPPR